MNRLIWGVEPGKLPLNTSMCMCEDDCKCMYAPTQVQCKYALRQLRDRAQKNFR